MQRILYAVLAIATCVIADKSTNRHGPRFVKYADNSKRFQCSESCAAEMGRCLIEDGDVETCL
jgi:hypothetical protein